MAKYAYVKVPANGYPEIIDKNELSISYRETTEAVGDCIDIVKPFKEDDIRIVCNDEGKLQDLRVNLFASNLYGYLHDYIAGDVIICGQGTNGDGEPDIIPLPIERACDIWLDALMSYMGVRLWQLQHSSSEN